MSAFLWVEDFEGGQYREFAHAIFGRALGLEAEKFPNEVNELREFLDARKVILVTNFAEASRFIANQLDEVDSIILDIDLELLGEDAAEDRPMVEEVLKRWYRYDPKAINEAALYNAARDEMKQVAGYHLFLDLVLDRQFPRSRLLFCSNHGEHLLSINKSFEPAKIESPNIFTKKDKRVSDWAFEQCVEPYFWLRRWVVSACSDLLARLNSKSVKFLMPDMPGGEAFRLTVTNAEILLEGLPKLLPPYETRPNERKAAFRLFIRTLTQDWGEVDYKGKDAHGMGLSKTAKAFAAVLKHARNWTSHDATALSDVKEAEVAFLFLIAMRSCFDLRADCLEKFETALLLLVAQEDQELDLDRLKLDYQSSYADIDAQFFSLPADLTSGVSDLFDAKIGVLQKDRRINVDEQVQRLMQICWHQLHWANDGVYSPQRHHFKSSPFLDQITRRIYQRSFG